MNCGYIYKIVFPNSKHYIGLTTTSLEQRTREHKNCAKSGDNRCVYNAIRKYNMIDTFELIEIDRSDTLEELYEKEIKYIIDYNSHGTGNGYNMTCGGDGVNGYIPTDDVRQKISESLKIYYTEHPEIKQQISERHKQFHKEHPEVAQQHSERQKKLLENPEAKQKNSEAQKKFHIENPEARQKMSESQKKRFENTEARQKTSEAQKKRFENLEERRKTSEAQKKYIEKHPEARHKISEAQKKRFENPETMKKILDAKGQNKPFDIFTLDGTYIKTFTYQFEAIEYLQKEHNITSTIKICAVLKGYRKSSAGFVFKYK
jgi:hypothetical protein